MRKMNRRLLSILLSLSLGIVIGLLPGMSLTAFAVTEVSSLPTTAGEYKLRSNISVDRYNPVELSSGNLILDLAGYTIKIDPDGGSINRTLYHITNGATLTIKDSSANGSGMITRSGTSSNDSIIWVEGGNLIWKGGTVSGVYTECGIVDVSSGEFTMTGGSFTGNTLQNSSNIGAIRLLSEKSKLNIFGTPQITGNTGGNVYLSTNSKINITGQLSTGAKISVNMKTAGVFTSGYGSQYNTESSASDPWNFFESDNSEYEWILWNDDFTEAMLGSKADYPEQQSVICKVTFDSNGGTGTMDVQELRVNTETKLTANSFIREGYSFSGWSDTSNGDVIYTDSQNVTLTEDTTLYAKWMPVAAIEPEISQPQNLELTYGYTEGSVSVEATAEDGHELSYQWYSNTTASNDGGTLIDNATSQSYPIPTGKAVSDSPLYYYCVVTATRTDNGKTADVTSDVATVTITKAAAPDLTDDQKPTPIENLEYTGEDQPLVTEPTEDLPEGYTMKYAVTTDNNEPAPEDYKEDIPNGKDVGTYYVWYKIVPVDSDNYEESEAEKIQAIINPAGTHELTDPQKPTAKEKLLYTGEEQPLVNAPQEEVPGYTVKYSIDGGETWTTELPTGTDAGTYTVNVKYEADDENHETFYGEDIEVTIAPISSTLEDTQKPQPVSGLTYSGEPQTLVTGPEEEVPGYTVKYSIDGGETWTTELPTGTDAGTYTVNVMYEADDENHETFYGEDIEVTIAPASATLTEKQKPQPETITYDGDQHALVTPPEELPAGYTEVEYSLDGGKTWSKEIPTGIESGDYTVNFRYIGDANHQDITGDDLVVTVTIGKAMELTVEADNVLKGNGARGIPSEIKNLEVKLEITITGDDGKTSKTVKPMVLTLNEGKASLTQNAEFDQNIENLAPGKQTVTVTVSPKVIYGRDKIYSSDGPVEGPVKWKYELSAKGEINKKDGKMIVRIYLIWDDGSRPEELKVYSLPEDEVGAYQLREDGTKEYLLFHTYDICMQWLGRDELCRGYERCFHKESPYVNPFVQP